MATVGYVIGAAMMLGVIIKWPRVGLAISAIVLAGAVAFGGYLMQG